MKKFILSYKLSPQFYSTGTPDDLLDTLGRMKSEGANLDDYSVMVINTEEYPSMTKSAREFLRDSGK